MTATDQLLAWNRDWRVFREMVTCRLCRAEQLEVNRNRGFEHVPGCPRTELRCQSWQELDEISAALHFTRE